MYGLLLTVYRLLSCRSLFTPYSVAISLAHERFSRYQSTNLATPSLKGVCGRHFKSVFALEMSAQVAKTSAGCRGTLVDLVHFVCLVGLAYLVYLVCSVSLVTG